LAKVGKTSGSSGANSQGHGCWEIRSLHTWILALDYDDYRLDTQSDLQQNPALINRAENVQSVYGR
jgi:hypothetical protein